MQKLYCYVDETGKEHSSQKFIVAVVIITGDRDGLLELCEQLEKETGKGKFKWGKAKHEPRMKYLNKVFSNRYLFGGLCYSVFPKGFDFDGATITAIVRSINRLKPPGRYTALVYVDGLTKTKRRQYSVALRRHGLHVQQVRGIERDENNSLTRLADAIAGFAGDALGGSSSDIKILFGRVKRSEVLIEV
jgi:uncharacterized protein DUF3800